MNAKRNPVSRTEAAPVSNGTTSTWRKLPNPSEKTIEIVSKTQFPNAIIREDLDEKLLRLCVTSIRCMLGLCFLDRARAYSFGVYLGSAAVEDLCGEGGSYEKLNPIPKEQLGAGPFYPAQRYEGKRDGYIFQNGPSGVGYYRDLRSSKQSGNRVTSPVLIRLVMLHDVDGEHIAHGFEKTLKSRILPLMKDSREELEQLNRLKMAFNRIGQIPKDAQVDLFRSETGVLSLIYNGTAIDHFDALLLGWACIDAFIGPNGHLSNQGKLELVNSAKAIYEVKPLAEFY
jgi:hypothetical protein